MISFRSRPLTTIDEVKREIVHVVERQKPGTPQDLSVHREEIDALLASFSEFLPEWRAAPSVFRVARLEVGEAHLPGTPWHYRAGIVPVFDNTVLPDVKHELAMIVQMLNFIREKRGLREIKMPLFLQPDEILDAIRSQQDRGDEYAPRARAGEPLETPDTGRRARSRLNREQLRRAVHDRHGWSCRECGATLDLHLHRIAGAYADDDPEGYVTLCRPCLLRAEGGGLKLGAAPTARGFDLEDESALDDLTIRSQLAVVFHKAAIAWVGFVFGKRFFLLKS